MSVSDRPVTLVTGSSKGIGRFLAEHYLARGHVVVGCSRGGTEWSHPDYHHFRADVSCEAEVLPIFKEISKQFSRLDHLINNAGIAAMNHSVLMPIKSVRAIFETNVVGTFLFCQEAARLMQRRKTGRIVNLSTVAVPLRLEGEAAYAASKAAIVSLTSILAKELASFGVTVNAVGPTPVQTDLIKNVPPAKIDALLQQQALKRFGRFEDVANVVDFYLDPKSDFITGQTLYLGGVG